MVFGRGIEAWTFALYIYTVSRGVIQIYPSVISGLSVQSLVVFLEQRKIKVCFP